MLTKILGMLKRKKQKGGKGNEYKTCKQNDDACFLENAKTYFGKDDEGKEIWEKVYGEDGMQSKINGDLENTLKEFDGILKHKIYIQMPQEFTDIYVALENESCMKKEVRTEKQNKYNDILEKSKIHIQTAIRESVKKGPLASNLNTYIEEGDIEISNNCDNYDSSALFQNDKVTNELYLDGLTLFDLRDMKYIKTKDIWELKFTIDSSISCVNENSKVLMANGNQKMAKEIVKGDLVKTDKGESKVKCVLKTKLLNNTGHFIKLDSGLLVTPWHPVKINGEWEFPCQNSSSFVSQQSEAVYSFLLENDHVLIIENTQVCGLAHNFKGKVIEHDYYGTNKVVEDLQKMEGWGEGLVELQQGNCIIRDSKTGNVSGLYQRKISKVLFQ